MFFWEIWQTVQRSNLNEKHHQNTYIDFFPSYRGAGALFSCYGKSEQICELFDFICFPNSKVCQHYIVFSVIFMLITILGMSGDFFILFFSK